MTGNRQQAEALLALLALVLGDQHNEPEIGPSGKRKQCPCGEHGPALEGARLLEIAAEYDIPAECVPELAESWPYEVPGPDEKHWRQHLAVFVATVPKHVIEARAKHLRTHTERGC